MKKLNEKIYVKCSKCKNNICIENKNDIEIMPVGYKGNYRYYTLCKNCGHLVTIAKENIPKRLALKLRIGMFF